MSLNEENNIEKEQITTLKAQRKKAAKPLMWIGIAGMAMMFAGLTSGYVVSRSALVQDQIWLTFALPTKFYVSTVMAIIASIVFHFSVKSFRQNKIQQGGVLVAVGFLAALGFTLFQVLGWADLYNNGIYFTGPGSNTAGSWVYAITFMHLLHVLAGLVAISITMIKGFAGQYSEENYLGAELNAIYWHFVDVSWIYLFIFLSIFR